MAETGRSLAHHAKGPGSIDHDYGDDASSFASESTQPGVKSIEAISQTWTRWSLIAAYFG